MQQLQLGCIPNWGHSELGAQSGRKNQPACLYVCLSLCAQNAAAEVVQLVAADTAVVVNFLVHILTMIHTRALGRWERVPPKVALGTPMTSLSNME